jgi:lysyl-tRNA synthetase class 2
MLARIRSFFEDQDVLAVDTPALSAFATSDPNIDNLAVQMASAKAYLHTSPESSMKCLLAAGYPDIFSICRVFRDGEKGPRHLPEFTLLEWYRRGFRLADIVADTTAMIARCLERQELCTDIVIVDYSVIFQELAGIDVFDASCEQLADAAAADSSLKSAIGQDRNAWLDLILVTKIAPTFASDRLTVLQHYPRAQAALARVCPDDGRVADRFEVFYATLELANGYVELTDAVEQRARFLQDSEDRKTAGKPATPGDELLLAALQSGLPECAGVAVGFERLQMIYEQTDNIDDVVTFSGRTGNE